MNSNESQERKVKAYLDGGGSLTPMDALNIFGIWRLAARIFVLRDGGMKINTLREKDQHGKCYARYMKVVK